VKDEAKPILSFRLNSLVSRRQKRQSFKQQFKVFKNMTSEQQC
jgi:hypothetical protein